MNLPEAVALILKAIEERELRAAAPKFYDVDRCEMASGNALRVAHRRGELRLYRIGKKLLVEADQLHAWIRQHEEKVPLAAVSERELDDVDSALSAGGVLKKTG